MLRLAGIGVAYGDEPVVRGVDLRIAPGEVVALLGPSGCGKTTLLRAIAGLEPLDSGTIAIEDEYINEKPPERRGVGMVFQSPALFPHLRVARNVAYGLAVARVPRAEREARAAELLAQVGLAGYGDRRVDTLSGGEAQRVALARALAPNPRVLLLDEPLSALDRALRESLRDELARLLRELGVTALYVTHDQGEAFAVGDRVALMRGGRLVQVAAPEALYRAPASAWAARFLGHRNVLPPGTLTDGEALLPEWGLSLTPRHGWRRIDAKLAEARFRRGRYAVELEALGRRLTLRTAEAPGEVAAVWYDAAAAVEFEG